MFRNHLLQVLLVVGLCSLALGAQGVNADQVNSRNAHEPIDDWQQLRNYYNPARWQASKVSQPKRGLASQPSDADGKRTIAVEGGDSILADLTGKAANITLKSGGFTVVVNTDQDGRIQVRVVTDQGDVGTTVDTNGDMALNLTSATKRNFVFESDLGNFTYARLDQETKPAASPVLNSTNLSLGDIVNLSSLDFGSLNLTLNILNSSACSQEDASEEEEASHANYDVALFNYDEHGDDWGEKFPQCAQGVQSPINLIQPYSKYGQSYEIFSYEEDKLRPEYWDLENAEVAFHKSIYSVEVYIDHNNGYAGFESLVGSKAFGGPSKWDAVEFIFHHGSEHTIEDERFDLELQIIHTIHVEPTDTVENEITLGFNQAKRLLREEEDDSGEPEDEMRRGLAGSATSSAGSSGSSDDFKYAIVSILFSVDNYSDHVDDQIHHEFDQFFEDLKFEEDDHISETILFGELMRHIDWSHRWVYKGSLTVPPCSHSVYWNVIGTVYPIKKKVVEAFNRKLNRAGLDTTGLNGNYRNVNKALNLDVFYVLSRATSLGLSILVAASSLFMIYY